jgi:microcystin-dependent protein
MILMADPGATVLAHSNAVLGATDGEERHQLSEPEMPWHNHTFDVNTDGFPDGGADTHSTYYEYWNRYHTPWDTIGTSYRGSSWPHNNMPPYIALNWIIKY